MSAQATLFLLVWACLPPAGTWAGVSVLLRPRCCVCVTHCDCLPEGAPTTMKLPRHVRVNFWCFFYHVLYLMIPLPQVLYLSGFGEISPCFLQDLQSNLCECQRLSCSDVVDYAVLTKLGKTFAATNTPRAHAALTKEDEHVNLFSMHWEGGMQLLVCKRAHQCSKPTRSSRTPSPRT